MTNKFDDLDNVGSSFALDDDNFEELLNRASAASEDDEGTGPVYEELVVEVEDQTFVDEPKQEQPTPNEIKEPEMDEFSSIMDDIPSEPIIEESIIEEPIIEKKIEPVIEKEPVKQVSKTSVTVPPVSEDEQIRKALQIIQIVDCFRKLSPEEQTVAIQFVTNGELDEAPDALLAVKVINVDPMLSATMKALAEAYNNDPVERAFYTMSLETKTLHNLGALVSVFSNEEYDTSLGNLEYSRLIVAGIAKLGEREMNFVQSTQSVLSAVELD